MSNNSYEYKGYSINIEQDPDPISPREDRDNLGSMVCRNKSYSLGDEKANDTIPWGEFSGWEQVKAYILKSFDVAVILPIYIYDHSGITLSTSPFGCQWDSGQVGWIYVEKEKVREWFKVKNVTDLAKKDATEILEQEVQTYSQYVEGEIYWYTILDSHGTEIDSCSGMYGYDYAKQTCEEIVDNEKPNSIKYILEE
jgi:hypothetical protein